MRERERRGVADTERERIMNYNTVRYKELPVCIEIREARDKKGKEMAKKDEVESMKGSERE